MIKIIGLKLNDFGERRREREIFPTIKKKFLERNDDDDRELQSESSGQV